MKTIFKSSIALLAGVTFFSACNDIDPYSDEQYFKQLYIVGAYSVVSTFELPYNSEPSSAFISITSSGSLLMDKDVQVKLKHNDNVIDWYNNKYMIDAPVKYQRLADGIFEIFSMETTLKSGEVYTRLPFTVNTASLHCDSLYALTFEIESVSEYQKTKTDTVLVLNFELMNDYSGSYQLNAIKYNVTMGADGEEVLIGGTTLSASRTLKAVDESTVRFFNEAIAESYTAYSTAEDYFNSIKDASIIFSKVGENQFVIQGWENMNIVASHRCAYNKGIFEFSYDYMSGSNRYRITGTLTK